MLQAALAVRGYAMEASDGGIGTVVDFLFDDRNWQSHWLVVDTGAWLSGRKILIRPAAITAADHRRRALSVVTTRTQIEDGPLVLWPIVDLPAMVRDEPVSPRSETSLYDRHGGDPLWRVGDPPAGAADSLSPPSHLGSVAAVNRHRVHTRDGALGQVEDVLIDDEDWAIRHLVVGTRNGWLGRHVLVSSQVVREVDWSAGRIGLEIVRAQVRESPPWYCLKMADLAHANRLQDHYQ